MTKKKIKMKNSVRQSSRTDALCYNVGNVGMSQIENCKVLRSLGELFGSEPVIIK